MKSMRSKSAAQAVVSMLIYYHEALVEEGCPDPRREMATVLPDMIRLSEAQSQYVKDRVENNSIPVMIDNMQVILSAVISDAEKGKRTDKTQLEVVRKSLEELNNILGGDSNGLI